jgi:hypothetical protein
MATITFAGAQITRPGSYSTVDSSSMVVSDSGSFRALAFIGVAPLLKAGTDVTKPLVFNSQTVRDAQTIIGAGDLLTHMNKAWQHGADLIYVSVVTPAAATPTDAEWQTAVDRLNKSFVDGVVPISSAASIIAKVHTHCITMSSTVNRKERRGFYGHAKGATVSTVTGLVTNANTGRAVIATPAVYDFDAAGNKVLFESTLLAAAYAGTWAGKAAQDPITYDYVTFAGLEVEYEAADITTLLTAGVAPVEVTRQGYRIVQGRTASPSADVTEQELSASTLKDTMSRTLRDTLEAKHVGNAGVPGIDQTIYNDAVSIIKGFRDVDKYITDYVADSITVVKTGTAFTVEWEGKPTLPINNFLITSHFTL